MKRRSKEQILKSKEIYRKHAYRYKAANYPEHRARRMLAYTAQISKATSVAMRRPVRWEQ